MKSKKLLIGLIVAAFIGGTHIASAQPKANYQNNLIEIGPDNIAGRVRAIVVDNADANHTTLYAGGVAGGLYKKVGDASWQFIPYSDGNQQITLPISCMIQLPDNSLLIGTGEGFVEKHGVNNDRMSPRGRGVYRYIPSENQFQLLSPTNPVVAPDWTFVNRLAVLERDNSYFIYAATNSGLFRWKLNASNPSWQAQPTKIANGNFQDVVILSADNIAYASTPGHLYRIGNVTGESMPVDVTSSNSAFAKSSRIELAAETSHSPNGDGTYTHRTYLYAVVANASGLLDGVYLTNDQQNWTLLTTPTVLPFNSANPGNLNAAICINPRNFKEVYVAGATMWVGQGFVENSFYQWGKQTYSEAELNYGNYMGTVYSDTNFVHSGIHQIVTTWQVVNGDTSWVTYFATDGGVYRGVCYNRGDHNAWSFKSINKGLNTVQFNSIAVSPDGSIIGGAVDNSCPFIQSRNAHNASGYSDPTWYDNNENSIMNHVANIIWFGNGGGVATSMFQQLKPYSRRALFVSSEPGNFFTTNNRSEPIPVASFGRALDDYSDYTNTQTWSVGPAFVSKTVQNSNPIPAMDIWETTNNTIWDEDITFTIDTALTYYHNGEETNITGSTEFVSGDSIVVASRGCFNYPFMHKFTSNHKLRDIVYYKDTVLGPNNTIISIRDTFRYEYNLNITTHNPVVSRMIISGRNTDKGTGTVYFNATPVDFSKIWDRDDDLAQINSQKMMWWSPLYDAPKGYSIDHVAFSRDGKSVFAVVSNDTSDECFVVRVYNITNADVNNLSLMKDQLNINTLLCLTSNETIYASDGNMFTRPVTSISVDKREGQDNVLLTFGGYGNGAPNMVLIKNACDTNARSYVNYTVTNTESGMSGTDPVYSALIEHTTGTIYAGTEKGVFTAAAGSNVWQSYGAFNGVPVTSIVQQTKNLPSKSYIVRDGVNMVKYLFAKTKYPNAIYFGTYGRGVFMDTTYVTDRVNEVTDSTNWVGITTADKGENFMKVYPNPAVDMANVELGVINAGNAVVKIYDISGKLVHTENLGYLNQGMHRYTLDCKKFNHGMYLVNINIGSESATSKLIVR